MACLMPNHFHLVVEPAHPTALSQFMQWRLTTTCAVITSIMVAAVTFGRSL